MSFPPRSKKKKRGPEVSVPAMTVNIAGHQIKTSHGKTGNFKIRIRGEGTDISINARDYSGIVRLFKVLHKAYVHHSRKRR